MLLPLLLSFALAGGDDPPVKVSLNNDNYFEPGDKARVEVKLAEDGYLLVLRADAQGRVRVLYPLDPSDDNFVRGRRTIEVRGRGDREAFFIDDKDGSGVVLAARSVAPFQFDEFVRGDHWDYRVLDTRGSGDDKETALLDMVQRMSPDAHFDYDVVTYVVSSPPPDAYHRHVAVGVARGWADPYPDGALIARRRSTTVPVRDAMQRDRGTPADRDAWVGRRSAGGSGGVDGSRSGSGGGGGGDRSADRPSERRGGGGSGWSAPRGSSGGGDRGARAAPSNRSGGGGGGSRAGGGGGGRRRP